MASFFEHVRALVTGQNSMLCVGLDTDNAKLPAHLVNKTDGIIYIKRGWTPIPTLHIPLSARQQTVGGHPPPG